MIRRRYPTPRDIRRAQWSWLPLLVPLFLLTWFGYQDTSLNIQKRRLDYEFNQLMQRHRDVSRRLESVTASLAAKRGYWTSTAFAQSLELQPPEPGQMVTVPAIPINQQIWELPLEPDQGQHALFAAEPIMPESPIMSPAVPHDTNSPANSSTPYLESVKPIASKNSASKTTSPEGRSTGYKQTSINPNTPAQSVAPAATAAHKNLKPASPDENPAVWLVSL